MYKIISIGIIAYISLISLFAQTKYWNRFRESSGRLGAVYFSEDETKADRIERRFYTKRGRKLVDCHILSLEPPNEIVGRIYFYPNGQLSQEILYTEAEGTISRTQYWDEDGTSKGAEINLADSSGFKRSIFEYPDGKMKYRTVSQYPSYYLQKGGWYSNGQRWFEAKSSKGQLNELVAYDSYGQVIDLALLAEDKISWTVDPELKNRGEISERIGYPQTARAEGIQGKVAFRLLISPSGELLSYSMLESPGDILTWAVEQYLWDLQFNPAQSKEGTAVYGWVEYFADFKLLK